MARNFNGSTDTITLSLGALGFSFGPGTVLAIVKSANDGSDEGPFVAGNPLVWTPFLTAATGGHIVFYIDGVTDASGPPLKVADGWAIMGVTKASGTVAPRFHRYVYSSGIWTHQAGTTPLANSSVPTTSLRIGQDGGGDFWSGDIAAVGAWSSVLSDAQIEGLIGNGNAWLALSPAGYWELNQSSIAASVLDKTAGGANQTAISGTMLATTDPPGWTYSGAVSANAPVLTPGSVSAALRV